MPKPFSPDQLGKPKPPLLCVVASLTSTVTLRFRALTMPAVTVPVRPSGLPMATTESPMATWAELPSEAVARPLTLAALITAMSLPASVPTTVALVVLPLLKVILMVALLSPTEEEITW